MARNGSEMAFMADVRQTIKTYEATPANERLMAVLVLMQQFADCQYEGHTHVSQGPDNRKGEAVVIELSDEERVDCSPEQLAYYKDFKVTLWAEEKYIWPFDGKGSYKKWFDRVNAGNKSNSFNIDTVWQASSSGMPGTNESLIDVSKGDDYMSVHGIPVAVEVAKNLISEKKKAVGEQSQLQGISSMAFLNF